MLHIEGEQESLSGAAGVCDNSSTRGGAAGRWPTGTSGVGGGV